MNWHFLRIMNALPCFQGGKIIKTFLYFATFPILQSLVQSEIFFSTMSCSSAAAGAIVN
jgi:hypothetical protein